jgi:hypothetical protein
MTGPGKATLAALASVELNPTLFEVHTILARLGDLCDQIEPKEPKGNKGQAVREFCLADQVIIRQNQIHSCFIL